MFKNVYITKEDLSRLKRRLPKERQKLRASAVSPSWLVELEQLLNCAYVVGETEIPDNAVTLQSQVTLCFVTERKEQKAKLALGEQRSKGETSISVFSPLGISLLGASAGTTISFSNGHHSYLIDIKSVQNPCRADRQMETH